MPGTPYLIDSNILLRWVKPDDRDYPLMRAFARYSDIQAVHPQAVVTKNR
jgi:hypothetical protein